MPWLVIEAVAVLAILFLGATAGIWAGMALEARDRKRGVRRNFQWPLALGFLVPIVTAPLALWLAWGVIDKL